MGFVYLSIEVVFRAIIGDMVGVHKLIFWSLGGWTTLWMLPVGGICGVLLGLLNEIKILKKCIVLTQCLIGTFIVLFVELLLGIIFNLGFGLSLWTYAGWSYNILGQICLPFAIIWFFLCPFVFWLDDFLRFALYGEDAKYSVLVPYRKLFTLK